MNVLYKYKFPLFIGAVIITFLLIPPLFFYDIEQIKDMYPAIMAICALLFAIPIRFFWDLFMRPDLDVVLEPEFIGVNNSIVGDVTDPPGANCIAVRAIIKNKGRSSALNCKGYLIHKDPRFYREIKDRICWIIDSSRETININSQDEERLDVFIIPIDGLASIPYIYYPIENGNYHPNRRIFKEYLNTLQFLVTSENTVPINVKINFNISFSSFEQLIALGEQYVEYFNNNPLPISFRKTA